MNLAASQRLERPSNVKFAETSKVTNVHACMAANSLCNTVTKDGAADLAGGCGGPFG